MKFLFTALVSLLVSTVYSQGPVITGLNGNPILKKTQNNTHSKRQDPDTLTLPFIDDFTSTTIIPNTLYWMDRQIFVNSTFPVSPPSFGVATFDNLDQNGRPYQAISGFTHNHCDSLTSNPINLEYFISGLNKINYKIADSIYFSFFYQTQGIGDPLDNSDSLVLKFKDSSGMWATVWKVSGSPLSKFKQVLIPILKTRYLTRSFQLRFINYGKSTGNMNQWHVDYVRMASNRSYQDTLVRDVAINAVPLGPLSIYETMPYDHFKVNASLHTHNEHVVKIRNNNTDQAVQVRFGYQVRNQYNQLVYDLPVTSVSRNILLNSDSTESFDKLKLDTFSGKKPFVNIRYITSPLALDQTPDDYLTVSSNNTYTKTVRFGNQLAYDDGSAEGGYGLDYGSLPAGPGFAAIKFLASKADTLRGISIFFNRSVADISFKSFDLLVWKSISEPPANSDDNDVILKRVNLATAIYLDSINEFVDIVFDTAVPLSSGYFYIGWQQNINFILNVGYDNNYKYQHSGGRNPNLFYNLNGYWENVNSTITGAPMMRPIVGEPVPKNSTSVRNVLHTTAPQVAIYPNPLNGSKILNISSDIAVTRAKVFDMNGRMLLSSSEEFIQDIHVNDLVDGVYFIELTDANGHVNRLKFIIN